MTDSTPGTANATDDPVILKITVGTLFQALNWVRRALAWLTYGYGALLLVMMVGMEWWGERFWPFGVLLYAPPQMMLLPLLALTPACLMFRPRLCGLHVAFVFVFAFFYMGFHWSRSPSPVGSALTIVSFNAGESSRAQFLGFIDREKPDIVMLQDSGSNGPPLAAKFPGSSSAALGEFFLVSRFPIQNAVLMPEPSATGHPVAARFEVLVNGRTLVLYSVHMPTPREQLARFIGGRRILGDLVGHHHREPAFGNYRDWLADRIRLARALAKVFQNEKRPFLVAGDFNTPDHGYIYHLFAGEMTDVFPAVGRGWGLTFPGSTHNPLTLFGPWLRLDYFFTGRGWRPIECRPEPGNRSQHKAVLARFAPVPEK